MDNGRNKLTPSLWADDFWSSIDNAAPHKIRVLPPPADLPIRQPDPVPPMTAALEFDDSAFESEPLTFMQRLGRRLGWR